MYSVHNASLVRTIMFTESILLIILFSIILLSTAISEAITLPCDSVVSVCPNTEVTFTCSQQSNRLIWRVPKSLTDNTNTMGLTLLFPAITTITEGPYTAVIIEGSNSYILSELTFTIPQQLNGIKEINCIHTVGNDTGKKTCMFKPAVISPILQPILMATGPTTVNITWSPPVYGSNCIDHYIITINSNNQYNSTTNTTSVIVSDLTVGMNYTVSVKVIDKGGQEEESETANIILEVPGMVSSLNYTVGNTNCACKLNVSWEVPTNTLLKPPITEYNIYHNITNGLLIKDTVTNNNIVFNDSVCGEYYTISVSAKNIIGNGNNVSINIHIVSSEYCNIITSPANHTLSSTMYTTSSVHILTQSNTVATTISTSTTDLSTSTEYFQIPTSSDVIQDTCSCVPCNSNMQTIISTVVTAVLVSVISVIVTCIVAYLLYWKKNKSYPKHKATDHVIYDTPDCINNNNTEMMERNVAYGVGKK